MEYIIYQTLNGKYLDCSGTERSCDNFRPDDKRLPMTEFILYVEVV